MQQCYGNSTQLNSTQLNVLNLRLRLTMMRNLVLNYINRRDKQQRYFRAAPQHQRQVVHLHAVINPHAGRNNAQKTKQEGQAIGALVRVQQKHEYHAPEDRQRRGRVRNHLERRIGFACIHDTEMFGLVNDRWWQLFNCIGEPIVI